MKQPKFEYKNGHAICTAEDEMGRIYKGEAWCAPEDADFENSLTGSTIAEMRAQIAAAKTYRDDLKNKLSALNQLLYSMNQSSKFSPDHYEAKMLYHQIYLVKNDLDIAKHQLAVLKLELFEYINDKNVLYQKIRESRNESKQ